MSSNIEGPDPEMSVPPQTETAFTIFVPPSRRNKRKRYGVTHGSGPDITTVDIDHQTYWNLRLDKVIPAFEGELKQMRRKIKVTTRAILDSQWWKDIPSAVKTIIFEDITNVPLIAVAITQDVRRRFKIITENPEGLLLLVGDVASIPSLSEALSRDMHGFLLDVATLSTMKHPTALETSYNLLHHLIVHSYPNPKNGAEGGSRSSVFDWSADYYLWCVTHALRKQRRDFDFQPGYEALVRHKQRVNSANPELYFVKTLYMLEVWGCKIPAPARRESS